MLVELGAYDAEAAHNGSRACAYIALAGHVVEVYPAALALYYALGAQHGAVLLPIVQRRKVCLEFVHGKGLGSLHSPAGKHLIGMVMVVMALAFGIVALPAVVMVMMLMLFAVIAVMMVMPAALVLIVIVVMVVAAAALIVVIVVMVMSAALVLIVVIVMVVMLTNDMNAALILIRSGRS